ncbi:class I SAM-dependent methyltransferase [Nostoc sp. CMAA1605]|uniref:class I SAM-dependent methyltransferase n=1 Tax=Nostoc sp. CMAA1605 TaxID=2055159 RepID=UPI001F3B10D8|nr:class I SAM-dependent methyltransferase [Nostoc sp. CMAA1605]MCF4970440.1 SAM-dependent methyltransferase [Nostoc sp. CMAA1605]
MVKSTYYDNIAHLYDQTRWLTESIAEEVVDFIIRLVNATPETSFLELGIGTGLNVIPLVKRGYSVTGIDASQAMLEQLKQKLHTIPPNLQLIHADASQLSFPNQSFDVVLTVHMIHTVLDWKVFLDEIERVLKPQGYYLNAQWITPPARMEFEGYFRKILAKYIEKSATNQVSQKITSAINIEEYFDGKGYCSNYVIAKEWVVSNTVQELLNCFKSRAYGLCWLVSDEIFHQIMVEFEEFCLQHYGSLATELSSKAKFEIWAYQAS